MTKSILMVDGDMPAAARAEILAALADSDCEVVFTEEDHVSHGIHIGESDPFYHGAAPTVYIEPYVDGDMSAPPDAGFGRSHRAQRKAGEAPAEILVMTRQQRRAKDRAAQKGR
jgi:hypothetical protein